MKFDLNSYTVNTVNQNTNEYISVRKIEYNIRLFKISVPRNYDDPNLFVWFYNCFENATGNRLINDDLTNNWFEKRCELCWIFFPEPALSAISRLLVCGQSYDFSIVLINKRFWRSNLVIISNRNKMLNNFEPVRSSSNVKAVRTFRDSREIYIKSLHSSSIVSKAFYVLLFANITGLYESRL